MREKSLQVVITFHTTSAAMAMERLCRARASRAAGPRPRDVTSDAASRCAPASARPDLESVREPPEFAGVYELLL